MEMPMIKLSAMISRERCPQIKLNAKSYTAGTTFQQENNSKTHPFPHNNFEPKLGLIRSYNVRTLVLGVWYISEHAHCSLGARRHRSPDINPLMQRGPGHINSLCIQRIQRDPYLKYLLATVLFWTKPCHIQVLGRKKTLSRISESIHFFSPVNIVNLELNTCQFSLQQILV